jgi:hypothetical protein
VKSSVSPPLFAHLFDRGLKTPLRPAIIIRQKNPYSGQCTYYVCLPLVGDLAAVPARIARLEFLQIPFSAAAASTMPALSTILLVHSDATPPPMPSTRRPPSLVWLVSRFLCRSKSLLKNTLKKERDLFPPSLLIAPPWTQRSLATNVQNVQFFLVLIFFIFMTALKASDGLFAQWHACAKIPIHQNLLKTQTQDYTFN